MLQIASTYNLAKYFRQDRLNAQLIGKISIDFEKVVELNLFYI